MPIKRALEPSPQLIERRLRERYGRPSHFNKRDPLSELVFIILSTQTREAEYRRSYAALWSTYKCWEKVRLAPRRDLERLIRFGGFARRKVALLQALLTAIRSDAGRTSLRFLRAWPDGLAMDFLLTLPGVGPKTARCVLMYSLGRPYFPVDTHVWRVARRIGWIGGPKDPHPKLCDALERAIAPELRHSLHVTLVAHGRSCCTATAPRCGACVLRDLCRERSRWKRGARAPSSPDRSPGAASASR